MLYLCILSTSEPEGVDTSGVGENFHKPSVISDFYS